MDRHGNEEELSFLHENMREIVSRISIDGNIEYVSKSFTKFLGYELQYPIGKEMAEFFHPEDKEKFLEDFKSCITFLSFTRSDLRIINEKGEYIWVETVMDPILNNSGQVTGVAACSRNIMQQKNMEIYAIKNKSKYQNLFENMDTGFAYFKVVRDNQHNPCDFTMLECNSLFKSITKFTKIELVGKNASELFDLNEAWYKDIFDKLKTVALTSETINYEAYIRSRRKYISCSFYCPYEGCVAVLVNDITSMKNKDELKKMIMYFSTRFINIPSEKTDEEINYTLNLIGKLYDSDCSGVYLYDKKINAYIKKYMWSGVGAQGIPESIEFNDKSYKWLTEEINKGNTLQITKLDEIPVNALNDKINLQAAGCKSFICIPITSENVVFGFMWLCALNSERIWSSEQIDLLRITCTIITGAIKRKESDIVLQNEIDELITLKGVLQDSEEKYRKLTFSIQDGIILVDNNEKIIDWNKGAEKIFGYSYTEVLGKKLHSLIVPPELLSTAEENFKKYFASGTGRFIDKVTEMNAMRKDGSKFRVEISLSAVRIKGVPHVVGNVRDITERRQAQKRIMEAMRTAETANKAKSQFLANMSHEIRTPMNGVMGFLDLLSKTTLDGQQDDYVKEMRIASDSLMNLINDLLDFSKIEAGKLELECIDFNLRKVIEEVTALFSPKAYSKGLELNARIDNSLPHLIKGDPGRLRQVLENLVSNAVKFTDKGEVDITAELVSQDKRTADVLFKVTDTGMGISDDDKQKLFAPFTQVDASTTRKYGGTGLGLTISEKIIEKMSGDIKIESEKGKGSEFIFRIRFEKTKNKQGGVLLSETDLKGIRILVVDKNRKSREIMRYYLEGVSCQVSEAETCDEAIDILRNNFLSGNRTAIAILACSTDKMKGMELADRIKSDNNIKDTSLVMLTSVAGPYDREAAEKVGFTGFLLKPVFKNDLLKCVLKAAGKSSGLTPDRDKSQVAEDSIDEKNIFEHAKILLAEDNATNKKLAVSILKNAGFSCDTAANGYEVIEALGNNCYDLVLMDCQMPEMDGFEATKVIRFSEFGYKHMPIIAMTANAMKSDCEKCIKAGMDDYISKPFKAEKLIELIKKWLKTINLGADEVIATQNDTSGNITEVNNDGIINNLDKLACDQMIDKEVIYEIYNEFVDDFPATLKKIWNAFDITNYTLLIMEAHTLKGSSATLRLEGLPQIAAELEKQARAGKISLCKECIEEITEFYKNHLKKLI